MTKRAIVIGQQGRNSRAFTWLDDEGVQLAVRMYITSVGEKLKSQGLANAVTAYLKEEDIGIDEENTLAEAIAGGVASDTEEVEGGYEMVAREDVEGARSTCRVDVDLEDVNKQARRQLKARTARKWQGRLGFEWKDIRKGVYIDGHDRDTNIGVVAIMQGVG